MNDDVYCVFILIACIVILVVPSSTGQVIVAVFAFGLAMAARVPPATDNHGHHQHHTRHDAAGR